MFLLFLLLIHLIKIEYEATMAIALPYLCAGRTQPAVWGSLETLIRAASMQISARHHDTPLESIMQPNCEAFIRVAIVKYVYFSEGILMNASQFGCIYLHDCNMQNLTRRQERTRLLTRLLGARPCGDAEGGGS